MIFILRDKLNPDREPIHIQKFNSIEKLARFLIGVLMVLNTNEYKIEIKN